MKQHRIKPIALYLPQFHRVRQNDEWWGEGFTEWTAVRNAVPLAEGQHQPREPLEDRYYDLLDKETLIWQSRIMEESGIYGFSFYHYWFGRGKQILEKPAENLLKWKDIRLPFCFYWANESWVRSWSNINSGNVWTDKFEKAEGETNTCGILLEQIYGREAEWKAHFDYLLPFFKDDRYIKKDGKPLFLIYKPQDILCLNQMIKYWDTLAKSNGLNGIYIIGSNCGSIKGTRMDARMVRENRMWQDRSIYKKVNDIDTVSYDEVWEDYLLKKYYKDEKTYWCGLVDFDDTPRRGSNGKYMVGSSPIKFSAYFERLLKKSMDQQNEFIFINAWNEWGEGMYLEPDKLNGYGYLNAVHSAVEAVRDYRGRPDGKFWEEEYKEPTEIEKRSCKGWMYYRCLHQWMCLHEQGISLTAYFERHHYAAIAIYGWGELGRHLFEELKEGSTLIKYVIDKKKDCGGKEIRILTMEDSLPEVDLIVVSPVYEYKDIENQLSSKTDASIVSLWDVIRDK